MSALPLKKARTKACCSASFFPRRADKVRTKAVADGWLNERRE
jgi:hypothetical protein